MKSTKKSNFLNLPHLYTICTCSTQTLQNQLKKNKPRIHKKQFFLDGFCSSSSSLIPFAVLLVNLFIIISFNRNLLQRLVLIYGKNFYYMKLLPLLQRRIEVFSHSISVFESISHIYQLKEPHLLKIKQWKYCSTCLNEQINTPLPPLHKNEASQNAIFAARVESPIRNTISCCKNLR